ncbi:S8 family serine peptidase [Microbacterium sp. SORGH_AS_0888]|uniref:S8 family serine peptidase n=1 Tax=Microbacterium sp. SORGH_AS_0888 TaxID=3041791 RepID=UPI0027804398|nr:S8 family serine peptidase [Microbacterium sp. SORGH_AS_0888]MDQ1129586.1 hypothetical protein [Microbacterium sp. SORGH_AS_0888]
MNARRALAALGLASALTLAVVDAATPATADDGQWWYSAYNVDQAHSVGWTGKGVKIAVIGQQINPQYEGLTGSHLTVDPDPICEGATVVNTAPSEASTHDTDVTSFLIGNGQGAGIRGIAPEADVTFIGYGDGACSVPYDPENLGITSFGLALKRAMQDGAQIVSTSTGVEPASDDDGKVLAEAIARGVVVVAAPPNSASEQKERRSTELSARRRFGQRNRR